MAQIKVKTKIDFKEYLKLQYKLFYKRPMIIFISVIGVLMLILPILYLLNVFPYFDSSPITQLAMGIFITIGLPFSIYYNAKRNFKTHGRLQETINYTFDSEKLSIEGDSFSSTMTWEKTYKVKELDTWLLIYQNKQVMNVIPKSSFSNEQLVSFRALLNEVESLKKDLLS